MFTKSLSLAAIAIMAAASSHWTQCAVENGTCSGCKSGTIMFGKTVGGTNFSKSFANGNINCNNSVFGDPAVGHVKTCWCKKVVRTIAPKKASAAKKPAASKKATAGKKATWFKPAAKKADDAKKANAAKKHSANYCYLRYCNWATNSDLPKAFCGGNPCKTDAQEASCKHHWFTNGHKENRNANPETCM